MTQKHTIRVTVNGVQHEASVEARRTLADFLRIDLGLTGTHLGCEHGVCGACTILVNGETVRSCLMFAVQADGAEVTTVEGIATNGEMAPIQEGFWRATSFQCGFCAAGFVVVGSALLRDNPNPSAEQVREAISGNLCRCTGYQSIVEGVQRAAKIARGEEA
jgi:carbon-monoxide dehydrogenase small subunit